MAGSLIQSAAASVEGVWSIYDGARKDQLSQAKTMLGTT